MPMSIHTDTVIMTVMDTVLIREIHIQIVLVKVF